MATKNRAWLGTVLAGVVLAMAALAPTSWFRTQEPRTGSHATASLAPSASSSVAAPNAQAGTVSAPVKRAAPYVGSPDPNVESAPAFEAFAETLSKRCNQGSGEGGTQQIVREHHLLARCLYGKTVQLAAALPTAQRKSLLVGPRDHLPREAWSPWWERLVMLACVLDDHYQNAGNLLARGAGSLRFLMEAECKARAFTAGAYLLESLRKQNAETFGKYVEATRARGQARLQALLPAQASAEELREFAPEDTLFDDGSLHALLKEGDWRRLSLRLRAFEAACTDAARVLCEIWPQLRERLGGVEACRQSLQAHFATYLPTRPEPYHDGVVGHYDYRGYPPARDEDYRRVSDPILEACRANEDFLLQYPIHAFELKCVACVQAKLQAVSAPSASDTLRRDWQGFVDDLCPIEQQAFDANRFVEYDDFQNYPGSYIEDAQCPSLAALRGHFLFEMLRNDEAQTFVRHVQWRSYWANQVTKGLAKFQAHATLEVCRRGHPSSKACRFSTVKPAKWDNVKAKAARLTEHAEILGRSLCDAWPALAKELTGVRCAPQMASYFLSYGHFLGIIGRDPEGHDSYAGAAQNARLH